MVVPYWFCPLTFFFFWLLFCVLVVGGEHNVLPWPLANMHENVMPLEKKKKRERERKRERKPPPPREVRKKMEIS